MLAAGAARAVRVDAEVALVDLDLVALGEERRDDDLREAVWRRCAESNGERRTSRWTPRSALKSPYAFSPRTVNVADLSPASSPGLASIDLGLEAAVGRPAEVHAEEHLGPVLRVGAARPGRDRDDRVAGVVLAVEERLLLQAGELGADRRDLLGDLRLERGVELEELRRVVDLAAQRARSGRACAETRECSVEVRAAVGLVVPEPGAPMLGLELGET